MDIIFYYDYYLNINNHYIMSISKYNKTAIKKYYSIL